MTTSFDIVAAPAKVGTPAIDRGMQHLADAINALAVTTIVGTEISVVPGSSPATIKVPHGLGRKYRGWVVQRLQFGQPTALYEVDSTFPTRELWLHFEGSLDIRFDLRVF